MRTRFLMLIAAAAFALWSTTSSVADPAPTPKKADKDAAEKARPKEPPKDAKSGASDSNQPARDQGVGVYIDGIYMPRTSGARMEIRFPLNRLNILVMISSSENFTIFFPVL